MTTLDAAPADTGTRLAIERTRLAYERTMMAWVRTSVSLISFGFTIHKFFQFRVQQGSIPADRLLGPEQFGGIMIGIGLVALVLASVDHRSSLNKLRASYGAMPRSVAATVGVFIAALGMLALVALIFGF